MKLAEISIRRPVMMTMVIMTFVVIGLFSLTRLGLDIMPEVEMPFVITTIVYPGAGPEEMETLVAEPIEEEISSIGGIKNVMSVSQEGMAFIISEFELDVDVDMAAIDIKDKVDAIRYSLPEDMFDPVIQKFDFGALPVITLAVSSPRSLDEIYRFAEDVIKPRLARIRGLANIELTGGLEREIKVNLSRRKLRAFNLSPQKVIAQIASQNLNIPAGSINEGRKEISVRMAGEFTDLDQLRRIEIPLEEGRTVRLEDIGWVEDDFQDQQDRAYFNGESSVGISLIKRSDANTVETANDVYKQLERIRAELPSDVRIDIASDRSIFIQNSVDDIFNNIIIGILLTALVLLLFLHDLPMTVIAAISMPASIIATFILIDFAGFTLNFMSLLGLAISIGVLVTNSIIILENIQRYKQKGLSAPDASSKGTGEIAVAVMAATLTNVVVFVPMAFMSGIVGRFFVQFGLTVAFATIFSLLMSFTLAPMMAARPMRGWIYILAGGGTFFVMWWRLGVDSALIVLLIVLLGILANSFGWLAHLTKLWDRFYAGLVVDYTRSLGWALRHKLLMIGAVILILIGSVSLVAKGYIGSEFFPKTDEGSFSVSLEMPVGTSLNETDRTVTEIGRRIMAQPYVKTVYVSSGRSQGNVFSSGQGLNMGLVMVQMVDEDVRPTSTAEFIDQLRLQLTDLPGAELVLRETESMGGGGEADMQVEITGYEMDRLNLLADSVMTIMRRIGGLVNIGSSWNMGKPELQIIPRREQMADQGSSPAALGMTLRTYVEGNVGSKYREGGEEYDIRVQLDPSDIQRTDDVASVYIPVGDRQVLLEELAELHYTEGPTSISRKNKRRLVVVSADVSVGTVGQKLDQLGKITDQMDLPSGYSIFYGGEAEMMGEAFGELFKALGLAIILTFMLLAALLESLKHPFTIMLTFPLGLIGVLLSLFLTGNTISMLSLMALVMLVGIVVNNGILLIDYVTQLRKEGRGLDEAILEACPIRLRPILMANMATAMGVLPLALGIGSGSGFRAPMGIVTIGGLITSTLFTLYIIPVIYRLFEREKA